LETTLEFCGDATQTDLTKTNERNGILDFMKIINRMPEFETIEFGVEDIVRSGLVKSYIVNKIAAGF
jgi:phosphate starvation-inducible protein PhoH